MCYEAKGVGPTNGMEKMMEIFNVGDRVNLIRSNPLFPVRTGTVTEVVRRGFNGDPDILRVYWNELGYEHNEPQTVLERVVIDQWSKYEITIPYGHVKGGTDMPPMLMLRHLWAFHYNVIASHRSRAISGSGTPVYDASSRLIRALIETVFTKPNRSYPADLVDRVYDIMVDTGEVPTVDQVQEFLDYDAVREDIARVDELRTR